MSNPSCLPVTFVAGVEMATHLVLDRQPYQWKGSRLITWHKCMHQRPHSWKQGVEMSRQQPQAVLKNLELAASLELDNAAQWLTLGLAYLNAEAPIEALRAFDAILDLNPNHVLALTYSADALSAMNQLQEAQQRVQHALALAPDDFRVLKRIADYRSSAGLVWDEAGKQTRRLIRGMLHLSPNAAEAYESLAYYHLFRGEWAKGTAILRQFTEQHPHSSTAWYYYAQCLLHTGDFRSGATAIVEAHALDPDNADIYKACCQIFPETGKSSELRPLITEMLERFPEQWSVWSLAGRALVESLQDSDRGCEVAARATQLQPQLTEPWFQYGRVLAIAGRHREAIMALEQGWLKLPYKLEAPQWISAAIWLGESHQALGDHSTGLIWLESARDGISDLQTFNPAITFYWQGRALEKMGNTAEAIRAYRTALGHHLPYPAKREVMDALKYLRTFLS